MHHPGYVRFSARVPSVYDSTLQRKIDREHFGDRFCRSSSDALSVLARQKQGGTIRPTYITKLAAKHSVADCTTTTGQ